MFNFRYKNGYEVTAISLTQFIASIIYGSYLYPMPLRTLEENSVAP